MSLPDPFPRTIVVTGAAGFVGSWLTSVLVEAGAAVRGIGRHPPAASTPGVGLPGVTFVAADVLDPAALGPALAGADAVVHLAARVHVMRDSAADPLAEFRRLNVEGTRVLLEEARHAGVRRFVFASTVKAVAESSRAPLDDHAEPRPVDPYGVSKLEAERLVAGSRDGGFATTILRLPLVYGPRMKGNMLSLFRLVDRGLPLPLGLVDNRRSLAFVGNVAAAIAAVLRAAIPPAGPHFVSDGRDLSTPELLRAIAAALGRPALLLPVPPLVFRAAGRLGDVLSRALPVPLTTAAVDRLLGSLSVDSSGLTRAVGHRPPYSVEEGLRLTADWYRSVAR